MKNVLALILFVSLCFLSAGPAAAKYLTYEVVAVTQTTVTLKSKKGEEFTVEKSRPDLNPGDMVRYDKKTNRLRKKTK